MKQQYYHTFMYFRLIYIVMLTWNDEYIFLSFVSEIKIPVFPTKTIYASIPFFTNVPLKNLNI